MHQTFSKISSELLSKLAFNSNNAKQVAMQILELSKSYQVQNDYSSIWSNKEKTNAYVSYFLPLNLLRLKAIFKECQKLNFFEGLTTIHDIGSGPGTTDFALLDSDLRFDRYYFYDKNSAAFGIHKELLNKLAIDFTNRSWHQQPPSLFKSQDLVIMSYSQVEIGKLPREVFNAEALILLEPSVGATARNLQAMREVLIENGYSIWAPCTHHESCPLLKHSKNDWCHFRSHVELPPSFQKIETYLPMKNNSLTYSYLCARKQQRPLIKGARIIGDTLFERGKNRQAICRNSNREFLSWLTKNGEPPIYERGTIIDLPDDIEIKNNELRWPVKN